MTTHIACSWPECWVDLASHELFCLHSGHQYQCSVENHWQFSPTLCKRRFIHFDRLVKKQAIIPLKLTISAWRDVVQNSWAPKALDWGIYILLIMVIFRRGFLLLLWKLKNYCDLSGSVWCQKNYIARDLINLMRGFFCSTCMCGDPSMLGRFLHIQKKRTSQTSSRGNSLA
jgi:hypothetical protein